jgi:hypothetical protein
MLLVATLWVVETMIESGGILPRIHGLCIVVGGKR